MVIEFGRAVEGGNVTELGGVFAGGEVVSGGRDVRNVFRVALPGFDHVHLLIYVAFYCRCSLSGSLHFNNFLEISGRGAWAWVKRSAISQQFYRGCINA